MLISPDRRLLGWSFAWLVISVLSVPVVGLRTLVPFLGGLLFVAVLADLYMCSRELGSVITRTIPAKGARERLDEIVLEVSNPTSRAILLDLREAIPHDLAQHEPSWSNLEIDAGSTRRLRYSIRPMVRGRREWGRAAALVHSPLGLLRRRVEGPAGDSILIQPETRHYLKSEALDPKRVLAKLGVRPKRARGDGLEFESLRDYVVGDEPRRIDWRATARRGRPIVRNHRHEESRTVLIAVDRSRLMGARAPRPETGNREEGFASTKLDHAIDAALALAFASLVAGDRVGLLVFDRAVVQLISPVVHRASLGLFVDALSEIQPVSFEADYRRASREILTLHRKRAMLVVLTDFMEVDRDELILPMSRLASRHETVFVALREPILEQLEEEADSTVSAVGPRPPDHEQKLYRRIVLADLLHEREARLVTLRRKGISVLDVPPSEATASTLNRYMELRYGAA